MVTLTKSDTHSQSAGQNHARQGHTLGWLVLACALITLIVCVFSWAATVGLLPERALASGESMLAADYSPWEGYRVLNLDVANLATAAAQGDAPWQGEGTSVAVATPVAVATSLPVTPVEITSQATPLPTLVPTNIPPTRRPVLPRATNTLPPTIPAVTLTATAVPTAPPPPPPPPPAPTSPPPAPTATNTPTPSDTPTSTVDTPTPTVDTPTPTATIDTPTATATIDTPTPTATTPPPVSNLALGKPATASSVEAGNPAAAGNDGNAGTRWCAVDGTVPQWWEVDLGASYNLVGSEVMWEFNGRTYQYIVEVSTDNVSWTTVVSNTTTSQTQADSFTATAQYVRITVTGVQASPATWASFYEFRVFGN
jgi:hypothetical protein